jgi:small subunit ribosomal protein S1
LADHKVENPEEIVKVGEQIEVKILRVDVDERKIGLSRKRVQWGEEGGEEPPKTPGPTGPATPSIPPSELKGGVGKSTGPLIQPRTPAGERPESK